MNFDCLVSTSRTRRPLPISVAADDGAEAAFACWCDRGFNGRPYVHCRAGDRYVVTDGHTVVKVQILNPRSST